MWASLSRIWCYSNSFQFFITEYDVNCNLLHKASIILRNVPSIPILLSFFYLNGCWILSNTFSASVEMIVWYLTFLLLIWSITLIDLQMLNHPCSLEWIPLDHDPFYIFLFGLPVQCKPKDVHWCPLCAYNFLYCSYWVWYRGNAGLEKWRGQNAS